MDAKNIPSYSSLDDNWEVDRRNLRFTSPMPKGRTSQRLIFNQPIRDGRISADVTIQDGLLNENLAKESRAGSIVFRFQNPSSYYFAGIGEFGSRFAIGKATAGALRPIGQIGNSESIEKGTSHHIEVSCIGNRFTLSHNGVIHLSVFDSDISTGLWGLHSWQSKAIFQNLDVRTTKPNCFVIMPFAPDFDDVYRVIQDTVEKNFEFTCIRADERYTTGPIMDDVFEQIERADVIISDLTGKNPNVFYEAGYAAALRKPTIQIAQSTADLPFDVGHLRTFSYSTKILGDRDLATSLVEAIRATTGLNPSS